MAVRVEAGKIAESLYGDDCTGNGIFLVSDFLEENLQRFPDTAAQIMQKFSIIEKVPAQDLRDAEDEMPGPVWLGLAPGMVGETRIGAPRS
jgi:hypothetical protein